MGWDGVRRSGELKGEKRGRVKGGKGEGEEGERPTLAGLFLGVSLGAHRLHEAASKARVHKCQSFHLYPHTRATAGKSNGGAIFNPNMVTKSSRIPKPETKRTPESPNPSSVPSQGKAEPEPSW